MSIPVWPDGVYQMTPHDEWDYDGVNEMILVDQPIGGATRKLLVHFDRNGFAYTLDRTNGELLVAEKYDPAVNWATKVDMDKNSKTYGRPVGEPKYSTQRRGHQRLKASAGCARYQGSAACGILTRYWPVLRADQPRLHGLRAVQGELHGRTALCRGNPVDVSTSRREAYGQLHCLGCPRRQDRLVE